MACTACSGGRRCIRCWVLGAVLLTAAAVDYTAYRRRMEEVTLLERRAGQFLGPLPEVRDPLEARYLALTAAVERRRREELSAAGGAAAKAREYYTLWSHQIKTPIAAMTLLLRDPQPDRAGHGAGAFENRAVCGHGAAVPAAGVCGK